MLMLFLLSTRPLSTLRVAGEGLATSCHGARNIRKRALAGYGRVETERARTRSVPPLRSSVPFSFCVPSRRVPSRPVRSALPSRPVPVRSSPLRSAPFFRPVPPFQTARAAGQGMAKRARTQQLRHKRAYLRCTGRRRPRSAPSARGTSSPGSRSTRRCRRLACTSPPRTQRTSRRRAPRSLRYTHN